MKNKILNAIVLTEDTYVEDLFDQHPDMFYLIGGMGFDKKTRQYTRIKHPKEGGIWGTDYVISNTRFLKSKNCAIRINRNDGTTESLKKIVCIGQDVDKWTGAWFVGKTLEFPAPFRHPIDNDSLVSIPDGCDITFLISRECGSITIWYITVHNRSDTMYIPIV